MYVNMHAPARVQMWKSEDNFVELVLSFHLYMDLGDHTHAVRLVWQVLCPTTSFCQVGAHFMVSIYVHAKPKYNM